MDQALFLTGPTAVGKTELGYYLADELECEVVNSDSVQVYQELDIGSAKPSPAERELCTHHLFDMCSPAEDFNVSEYLNEVQVCLGTHVLDNHLPLFIGGSSMYIQRLLLGLDTLPKRNQELRAELDLLSCDTLYQRLQELDPDRAIELNPNDRLRVVRAIEVASASQSQALFKSSSTPVIKRALVLVALRPRDELYARIDRRSEEMIELGLFEESKALFEKYGKTKALSSLGYRECIEFIESGQSSLNAESRRRLVNTIAQSTRRYAKRQMTFWRNEPSKRAWSKLPDEDADDVTILGSEGIKQKKSEKRKGIYAYSWHKSRLLARIKEWKAREEEEVEVLYVDVRTLEKA
jgi:tRNA dimethylallyltransferase